MARYVITQRVDRPDGLMAFEEAGYRFSSGRSSATKLVFLRDE
jgi:cytoplasmic iron level regulating protein YaaA (DUF328/UPF0246 family)